MVLRIRTRENLEELLRHCNSPSWVISEWRVPQINSVEIYQFDGKRVLRGDFDILKSSRTENGRLIVAFSKAIIEDCDFKWIGQNPVKYHDNEDNENKKSDNFSQYKDYIKSLGQMELISDFEKNWLIPLKNYHFQELTDSLEYLCFRIDNSDYAWEELGGEESLNLIFHIPTNSLLPSNYKSFLNDETDIEAYMSSRSADIYHYYRETKSYNGCFSVSSLNENSWYVSFHGDSVDEYSENLDIELLNNIKQVLNPEAIYSFLNEAILILAN